MSLDSSRDSTGVPARRGFAFLEIMAVVLLGCIAGIWSAKIAVDRGGGFGRDTIGPWQFNPRHGGYDADPYAHAALVRRNEFPMGTGEGQFFLAHADSSGLPLNSRCLYRIDGALPRARAWTLLVYRPDGRLFSPLPHEHAMTSASPLYARDGAVTILVSSTPQPGNWLQVPPETSFSLAFQLYDPSTNIASLARATLNFPAIERLTCN